MIAIVEGKIGGGKTYLCVSRILAHLAKGGTVFTNVELVPEGVARYLAKHHQVEFDPESIVRIDEQDAFDFHRRLRVGQGINTLCVIDEAHLWFHSRDHAITAQTRRGLLTFLSQSRKLHVDVLFIVQSADNLDAQFRRLAQEFWRCKDLSRLRVPLLNIPYPFPHTLVFRVDTGSNQILDRKLLKRDPDIFEAYNTDALLRPVEFAGEIQSIRQLKRQDAKSLKQRIMEWQPSTGLFVWSCGFAWLLWRWSL